MPDKGRLTQQLLICSFAMQYINLIYHFLKLQLGWDLTSYVLVLYTIVVFQVWEHNFARNLDTSERADCNANILRLPDQTSSFQYRLRKASNKDLVSVVSLYQCPVLVYGTLDKALKE